ncbi:MAG: chromosome segregation protein SMC [bacterium]
MILESISIRGFKSFEGPIKIPFKKGISAIVGPNGCGKSNIADAIRWVLGEQSARLLRGRNMEDVIFNGSSTRKPLGMVEVTLDFTNEGDLPVDYHQIRIARRLFRSGESVYLLNKTPCRLKDITNLFISCGLGKNAYFCIEQGNIDFIITAKPEERRILIETSAGILKYKEQKKEAIKKIEDARQNLIRLKDISTEVESQYNHLESQAAQAKAYKELMDQTDRDEQDLLKLQYTLLKCSKDQIDGILEKIKDKEIGLQTRGSAQEVEIERLQLLLSQKETELSTVQRLCWSLEKEITQKNEQLSSKEKEYHFREESLTTYIKERDALRIKKANLVQMLEKIKGTLTESTHQLEQQHTQHQVLQETLHKIQKDRSSIHDEIEKKRKNLSFTSAQIGILQNNQNHLLSKKDDISRQFIVMIEQIEKILESILSLEEKRDYYLESKIQVEGTLSDLEKELAALTEERSSCEHAVLETHHTIEKTTIELERLKTKKEHLIEMEKRMEGFGEGVRCLLTGSQSGKVRTIIAQIIETDPGYECAVESALGPSVEHMLVDSCEHGLDLIRYLKEKKIGRGTFIPLQLFVKRGMMRPDESVSDEILQHPCVLGRLVDFIRYPAQYRPIIMYLLGDLIVTQDIESSLDMLEHTKKYFRMVTMAGDLIVSNGVVSGGSENGRSDGFLKRKRELRQVCDRIGVYEERLVDLKKQHALQTERLLSLKEKVKLLTEKKHDLDTQKKDIHREVHYTQAEIDRQKRHEDRLRLEKEARLGDQAEIAEIIKNEEERIDTLRKEQEEMTRALETIMKESEAFDEKYQRINKDFLENKVALSHAEERIKSITKERELLCQSLQEIEEKEKKDQHILQELKERLVVLQEEKADLKKALPQLHKECEEKNVQSTRFDAEIGDIREQLTGLNRSLRTNRQNLDKIRREKQEKEITSAQYETQLRQLFSVLREPLPEHSGDSDVGELEKRVEEKREKLAEAKEKLSSMGYVNMGAIEEFEKCGKRLTFLNQQQTDLETSITSLSSIIKEINATSERLFMEAFHKVNENFKELFNRLFEGGEAELTLDDNTDILETGIEISARAPGKRQQNIILMSGGEKALTAFALMMAVYQLKPSPFCILDEADAALDEINTDRFINLLRETKDKTQFIVITHSRKTIMAADILYGITMETPGVSKVIPTRLDELCNVQPLAV